jgi:hypothetical protein
MKLLLKPRTFKILFAFVRLSLYDRALRNTMIRRAGLRTRPTELVTSSGNDPDVCSGAESPEPWFYSA